MPVSRCGSCPGSRGWDSEDKLLIGASASLIRMVLEHEAIQLEMARQAKTDPLTGLHNRRAFLEEMTRHIDRLDREEQPGTLLFADLDYFKPVNDRLGHEAGDEVLVRTAQRAGFAADVNHPRRPRRQSHSPERPAPPASSAAPAPRHPCATGYDPALRRAAALSPRARHFCLYSDQSMPMPRVPTTRPSASISGAAETAIRAGLPSARCSQARRRRTGMVIRNGLKPLTPVPPASSSSAGWSISVATDQPSAGSGIDEDEAAPGIGFIGKIGGGQHEIAPSLPAIEQSVAQARIGQSRGGRPCGNRVGHDARSCPGSGY